MSTNASIVYEPLNKKSYTRTRNPNGDAYLNAMLTLQFWKDTGVDVGAMDFVVEDDLSPVLTNEGDIILNG